MSNEKKQFNYVNALQAIAKGNQKSLRHIYEQEATYLYSFAYKVLKQQTLAEDAVAEVFRLFWHNANSYEGQYVRGWLYTIFRYHLAAIVQKTHALNKENNAVLGEVCTNLHAGVHHYLEAGAFYQVFEELPEQTQRIFITAYFCPESHANIASLLHISPTELKENITLGLQHLAHKRETLNLKHEHAILIGEFILGGMSDANNERVSQLLARDVTAKALSLIWEEEFLHFLKQLVVHPLPETLWARIKASLSTQSTEGDTRYLNRSASLLSYCQPLKKRWSSLFFWRSLSAILIVVLGLVIWLKPFQTPIKLVAVMTSTLNSKQVAFTVKQTNRLIVRPVIKQNIGHTLRLQLWRKTQQGELQAITALHTHTVTAHRLTTPLAQGDILFISLEPIGASLSQHITGQVLYQGILAKP